MGLNLFGKCSSSQPCRRSYEKSDDQKNIAPDPQYFTINRILEIGNNLVAEITYHNCTNFEGKKNLVFKNMTSDHLNKMKILDPHFSEKPDSPVARFRPDKEGFQCAMQFAQTLCLLFITL